LWGVWLLVCVLFVVWGESGICFRLVWGGGGWGGGGGAG